MKTISFFVQGIAKPAGSKRGFHIKSINRVVITDACKGSRDWKTDVSLAAQRHYSGPLLGGPLSVHFTFFVTRPKSHYRTGKNAHLLRDSAPIAPITKPDVLKLSRGVEDALTSIIWKDDAQIVDEHIKKRFADVPGVQIEIREFVE